MQKQNSNLKRMLILHKVKAMVLVCLHVENDNITNPNKLQEDFDFTLENKKYSDN